MGGVNLEHRKLIRFGSSSYVVSLPIKWLKRNNLNKGDIVYFEENGNGELVLSPEVKEEKKKIKEITLNLEDKSLDNIDREIRSAYIKNYNLINLVDRNLEEKSRFVRELIHNLFGIEVIEQTHTRIVLKDLLDVDKVSIRDIVRRMDIIVRIMIKDSKDSVVNKNKYESLADRDLDVNRLYFLAWKVIQCALNDQNYMKLLGLTYPNLVANWWIAMNLEKIGDDTKRIARSLKDVNLTDKQVKGLIDVYSSIEENYLNVMKAYYTDDKKLAYKVASRKIDNIKKCDDYLMKNLIVPLALVVEKLKSIESYTRHIVRCVVDIE